VALRERVRCWGGGGGGWMKGRADIEGRGRREGGGDSSVMRG